MNEIRQLAEPADKGAVDRAVGVGRCYEFRRLGQPQSAGDGGYTRLST